MRGSWSGGVAPPPPHGPRPPWQHARRLSVPCPCPVRPHARSGARSVARPSPALPHPSPLPPPPSPPPPAAALSRAAAAAAGAQRPKVWRPRPGRPLLHRHNQYRSGGELPCPPARPPARDDPAHHHHHPPEVRSWVCSAPTRRLPPPHCRTPGCLNHTTVHQAAAGGIVPFCVPGNL